MDAATEISTGADLASPTHPQGAAAAWLRVNDRLRRDLGDAAWKAWIAPLACRGAVGGRLLLVAPSRFLRDWVLRNYDDRILSFWAAEAPLGAAPVGALEIDLAAAPRGAASADAVPPTGRPQAAPEPAPDLRDAAIAGDEDGEGEDAALQSSPLDPRFTFEGFVVAKPNELAHAAARRVAEAGATVPTSNPLFLYGGVGLGKTHLMHAIALEIRRRNPRRKVVYMTAEKFMYHFVRAVRYKTTHAFKQAFRSVDVLMIDDIQFICGKDATQEEFFHTFNALVDHNRQVVVSADKSPSDLEDMEERLRSRLGWGLVADIHPTTYELRLGILQHKAELARIAIPQRVLEFVAHRISSNVRELEGALNRIVAQAELVGRAPTVESATEALRDLIRASDRRVTVEEIQKRVAEHFHMKLAEMSSARRSRAVARPRQVAMYLAKKLTPLSLPEIGKRFGGRDHTTVMHACKKVEELIETDVSFAESVELLRRSLQGG